MGSLYVYAPDKNTGLALCRLLKRRQLLASYYDSAEELLEKIRFGDAGVVVLDFSSLSSMSVLTKELDDIFALPEETPIIMLTPYDMDERETQCYRLKGYHMFGKPVCLDDLAELIHKLC